MARVEEHAATRGASLSPAGASLPDHCEPCSGQSNTLESKFHIFLSDKSDFEL